MPLEDTTITQSTHTSDPRISSSPMHCVSWNWQGALMFYGSYARYLDSPPKQLTHTHFIQSQDTLIPHTPSSTTYFKTHKRFSSQYKNHTHPKKTVTKHSILFWNSTYKKHATHTISDTH